MAIATATALALAGAAATAGGAVMGASATKKAAKTAANAASQSSAANTALARENYANNSARLDPYAASGMRAGGVLNEMLLGPAQGGTVPAFQNGGMGDETWANGALSAMGLGSRGNSPATLRAHLAGELEGEISPQMRAAYDNYRASTPMQASGGGNAVPGQSAWDQFRNSTNYQFRLNEGNKAFTQGAFAKGMGESGAAIKGAIGYNQNFAANELGQFQDRLFQQQQTGLGAASALAGVGQNMVSNVSANNNNAASAIGNAALVRGQAQGQMWGSIAGALGSSFGAFG